MPQQLEYGHVLQGIRRAKDKELCPGWLPPFLSAMWLTGARVSEVLGLKGEDFKQEYIEGERVIYVRLKNLKQRSQDKALKEGIIVPSQYPELWEFLEDWIIEKGRGPLFNIKRQTVWYHCDKVFGMGTHQVGRHSWVMEKARKGTGILDAKQLGGWSRLASMNPYVHEFGKRELAKRLIDKGKPQE